MGRDLAVGGEAWGKNCEGSVSPKKKEGLRCHARGQASCPLFRDISFARCCCGRAEIVLAMAFRPKTRMGLLQFLLGWPNSVEFMILSDKGLMFLG